MIHLTMNNDVSFNFIIYIFRYPFLIALLTPAHELELSFLNEVILYFLGGLNFDFRK